MTTINPVSTQCEGLYVYCVARGDGNPAFGAIGLDGRRVYAVIDGGLCAIVHDCPSEPYQSQDPNTVAGWVAAHQDVVRAATEAFGTVLPMSFDMIVRGDPTRPAASVLKVWLDEKHDRFSRLLEKLKDKAEYGVQVFWDREAIAASLADSDRTLRGIRDEARTKSKGMAHMLQQKLAKAVRKAMENHADMLANDFYTRIRQCAEDVRIDKLKKIEGGKQMLLNLSCLMKAGCGDLGDVLDDIQATKGVSVRFTGPWPPYSFVGG